MQASPLPDDITPKYCRAASSGRFRRFFGRRNALDLPRDTSGHRRYAWLYEDMLT